jgi:hypothetical protein
MIDAPFDAPACFAAASVFSHDSDICKMCSAFEGCAAASVVTLETIKGIVNVEDLLKRHTKAKKIARVTVAAKDKLEAETRPPGANLRPLMLPVERQTKVIQVKFELTEEERLIVEKLPVKLVKLAPSLIEHGLIDRMKKDIPEGRNTFATRGPQWLRVALTALLAGGFTKPSLRDSMMSEFTWTSGTAASHVSMVCSIFTAFGITKIVDGKMVPATA